MDMKVKICGICGREFNCGSPFGCWCSSIKLSRDQLVRLSKISSDCVCPDCLKKASEF